MRPHRLRFCGIGPYPGEVAVDFDALGAMGLYLIVGPTGAGKSTIFDAMTFALFGKTASGREGSIASNFGHAAKPEVELEFSHKDHRYVVHREPAPSGKNIVSNKQWIRELDSSGNEIKTVTQTKLVTQFVEETLGLDADQFMKVVLLPQGQFMEFLMAKSNDKAPMLKAIFGTHLYGQVVDRMDAQARTLHEKADASGRRLQEQRATATALVANLEGEVFSAELPDVDDDLSGVIAMVSGHADTAKQQAQNALDQFNVAATAFTKASDEARRFDAAEELKELHATASSRAKLVERAKVSLADHERAVRVTRIADGVTEAETQRKIGEDAEKRGRTDIQRVLAKLRLADGVAETLQSAVPSATPAALRTEHQKLQARVSSASDQFGEVAELDGDIASHEASIKAATKARDAALASSKKLDDALTRVSAELAAARASQKQLVSLDRRVSALNEMLEKADVAGAKQELVKAQERADKAHLAFTRADEAATKARADRTRHLAGELAAGLKKNDPCPVCGSTDHPAKARPTTEVDIGVKEEQRTKAWGKKVEADTKLDEAADSVNKALAAKEKLPSAKEQNKLRSDFDKAQEAVDSIEALEDRELELREEIEELKSDLFDAKETISVATKALATSTKKRNELNARALAMGTARNVETAIELLDEVDELLADLEESVSQANDARSVEATARKSLSAALKTEHFADATTAASKVLDDDEIAAFTREISEDTERLERITLLTGQVGTDPVPKTRPDLDALSAAKDDAERIMRSESVRETQLSQSAKMLSACLEAIEKLGPEVDEDAERSRQANRISTVFRRGAGSGEDAQLGLETWVLRTLFEEVCEVATEQMRVLSGNRYILTLESAGGIRKRRDGGLDLYVLDSHTGMTRPVGTLSGGEQFQTSLALALALAEVVQRHAGGIELSSLFIDEGFGSLDEESLDDAINVLKQLNDIGRTVGVITHVERMKEELPVGIRIHKDSAGSTLELVEV